MGAITAGFASYAALGVVGGVIPGSGPKSLATVLVVGLTLSTLWYLKPRLRWLPSPRQQARKDLVEKPYVGALAFGAILGIGWLTVVVTPLVWVGVAGSLASGSVMWSALYGIAFGFGRSFQLWAHHLRGAGDIGAVVERTLVGQASISQRIGLAGGPLILAMILSSHLI